MATTSYFLDTRRTKPGRASVLKIAINHRNTRSYISLDAKLLPKQWDAKRSRVIKHPNEKLLNMYISGVWHQVEQTILILTVEGRLHGMTALDIRDEVERKIFPEKARKKDQAKLNRILFAKRFLDFAHTKSKSTCGVYMQTYLRMTAYAGHKLNSLKFEDITKEWLRMFECFLAQTSPSRNARNIHLRNIRAFFNDAIDNEITAFYPFRGLPIRPEATPKRDLKVDELRLLFDYPAEKHALYYIDIFKLIFMLIGINVVDLCRLKEIEHDRINYRRAKTHRLYSIKVEPEAMEIIDRYRGKDWLLDILDRYKDHNDFTRRINKTLKNVGPMKRVGLGGKKFYSPLFPKISTYWARYSWASIAMSIDIPRDTIAHALGHGTNTVTDIYINFDQSKVDDANRRVLDWVLYDKR